MDYSFENIKHDLESQAKACYARENTKSIRRDTFVWQKLSILASHQNEITNLNLVLRICSGVSKFLKHTITITLPISFYNFPFNTKKTN